MGPQQFAWADWSQDSLPKQAGYQYQVRQTIWEPGWRASVKKIIIIKKSNFSKSFAKHLQLQQSEHLKKKNLSLLIKHLLVCIFERRLQISSNDCNWALKSVLYFPKLAIKSHFTLNSDFNLRHLNKLISACMLFYPGVNLCVLSRL